MLQRSVTLIRRLLWTLPNESIRRSGVGVIFWTSRGSVAVPRTASFYPIGGRGDSREAAASSRLASGDGGRFHAGMDPFLGAVGPDLLLPDRDDLLEGVDQPSAGLERL